MIFLDLFSFSWGMRQSYAINWVKDLIWYTWHNIFCAIKTFMFLVCRSKKHSLLPKIDLLYKRCERVTGNFMKAFSSHLSGHLALHPIITNGYLFLRL